MKENPNKALVREFIAAIDKLDLGRLREMLSSDYRLHYPPYAEPVGAEESLHALKGWYTSFPDWIHEITDLIAEGDRVAATVKQHGTHKGEFQGVPPTGTYVTIASVLVFRIENGKIRDLWVVEDTLGQMQQLGMELKPKRT